MAERRSKGQNPDGTEAYPHPAAHRGSSGGGSNPHHITHHSPLTTQPSPSPLTAHRSPLTFHPNPDPDPDPTQVRPWCVDVSSGVETDGVKDVAKMQAYVRNAKAVE